VFVVDTNLLVYAADEDFAGQGQMRQVLRQWGLSSETWYVTWSIVYEFLSVSTQRLGLCPPALVFAGLALR